MRITTPRLITTALVAAPLAAALFVNPSSPCAKYCGNVLGSTSTDEMACTAATLATSTGVVWEQCMNCLLTSTYGSGDQTDTHSLICMWRL